MHVREHACLGAKDSVLQLAMTIRGGAVLAMDSGKCTDVTLVDQSANRRWVPLHVRWELLGTGL